MLSFEEALEKILERIAVLGTEEVGLLEAVGRTLAGPAAAPEDIPNYQNSAMDGYAVIAADTKGASQESPVELEVIEEVPAGHLPQKPLASGTASHTMTGAALSENADAIVMVEKTGKAEAGRVKIFAEARPGDHIRQAGEDVKAGAVMFEAGHRVRPKDLGMLALLSQARLKVYRRPRVAVVATGDEVLEIDQPSRFGCVRNSNSYALCGLCAEMGAEPVYWGIIPDRKEALLEGFSKAAETCDVVMTSGGVSMGDYDIVKEALDELGSIEFWKARIKPGKPLAFGQIGGKPFFGLPGNPVSAVVIFDLFAHPALQKMMGAPSTPPAAFPARLLSPLKEKTGRLKFIRGICSVGAEGFEVKSAGAQGSGVYSSIVAANCYIMIPEEVGEASPGDTVQIRFPDGRGEV